MGRPKKKRLKTKKVKPIQTQQGTPVMRKIMRGVSLSLKKRRLFSDFIYSYSPIPKKLMNSDTELDASMSHSLPWTNEVPIGKGPRLRIRLRSNLSCVNLEKSLFGRLILLTRVLYIHRQTSTVPLGVLNESYAADELTKMNKKVYSNEFVYEALIGSIFAIGAMILLIGTFWIFFSLGFAFFMSCFWTMTLLIFYITLTAINKENLEE